MQQSGVGLIPCKSPFHTKNRHFLEDAHLVIDRIFFLWNLYGLELKKHIRIRCDRLIKGVVSWVNFVLSLINTCITFLTSKRTALVTILYHKFYLSVPFFLISYNFFAKCSKVKCKGNSFYLPSVVFFVRQEIWISCSKFSAD